jgi:heterodisulfide reductase subunit A
MQKGKELCGICSKGCGSNAINFNDKDEYVEFDVGAIVVATGYKLYSIGKEQENPNIQGYGEYGYGKYKDVVDSLQFERIISASGPTGGEPKRPSDGMTPKTIVFIQCTGSRDNAKGITYCSKICCMYTAKHTMLFKHKVHDGAAHVFYMDIRSGGKMYDEFVRRAIEQGGAQYHRGRVSKIEEITVDGVKKYRCYGADTLAGTPCVVDADMVVLACAMVPSTGVKSLAQKLSVGYNEYGFLSESHPKLRPVETNAAGVFVCGACQGPKDIPETVAQASAAAGKALIMLSQPFLTREPEIATVDEKLCAACGACVKACPYKAISIEEIRDRKGNLVKMTSRVNPGLCMGCGTCVAVCPSKSVDLIGFTDDQVYAQIESLLD